MESLDKKIIYVGIVAKFVSYQSQCWQFIMQLVSDSKEFCERDMNVFVLL